MASNTTLIKKLQHAINDKGERLLYHTSQWYSEDEQRPITRYSIQQAVWDEDKGKFVNKLLFSASSQIQILLYLRDYWYNLNGWEIPNNNKIWNKIKAGD